MRMVQNHHTVDWSRYLKLLVDSSPIVDCGVHYIDVMQWATGSKVSAVSGLCARTEPGVPDNSYNYGMLCIRFEDGSAGYYEAGWGNTIASENTKEFIGPKGRIKIIYRNDRNTHQEEGDLIEYYSYPENEYKMINIDSNRKPTWEQLQHLTNIIETGIDAVPSIDEVFNAYQIALIADSAIKSGQSVNL